MASDGAVVLSGLLSGVRRQAWLMWVWRGGVLCLGGVWSARVILAYRSFCNAKRAVSECDTARFAMSSAPFGHAVRQGGAAGLPTVGVRGQWASSQLAPHPQSATSGTFMSKAPCISSMTMRSTISFSSGSTLKFSSSCTWSIIFERTPSRAKRSAMRIMATLIMSAAVPCIGALMALRSAKPRTVALRELMSGR